MATFTIRNDSESYISSVTSILFENDPAIYHIANLSALGGLSTEFSSIVVLDEPYTLLPLSTVNFDVTYALNTLTIGTYLGTVTVLIGLSSEIVIVDGDLYNTISYPNEVDGGVASTVNFINEIDGESVLSLSSIITTTQYLTATNNVTLVATTGTPQYTETAYNIPFVYNTGTFTDAYSPLGPISANSGGVPSGSLPGDFE